MAGDISEAITDIGERRHAIERVTAEVIAEIVGGDRGVDLAARLGCAGYILGADRLDLAGLEPELLPWVDEPEGNRAILFAPITEGDFPEQQVATHRFSYPDGICQISCAGHRIGPGRCRTRIIKLPVGVPEEPVFENYVEDVGERTTIGDHGDAFELDRYIVGVVDHHDRIDRHADGAEVEFAILVEGVGLVEDAREHHRETDDAWRQAHRGRPSTGRELSVQLPVVEIGVVVGGAREGDAHPVMVRDDVRTKRRQCRMAVLDDIGIAQPLFGLEARRVARGAQVVAIVISVIIEGSAAGVEIIRPRGEGPGGSPCARAGKRRGFLDGGEPVAGGVSQRFDATGEDGVGRGGGLAAEGPRGLARLFELTLIHTVVVAVEVPSRSAGDASSQVLVVVYGQFGPRQDVDALRQGIDRAAHRPGDGARVGASFGIGEKPRDRVTAAAGVSFEEG